MSDDIEAEKRRVRDAGIKMNLPIDWQERLFITPLLDELDAARKANAELREKHRWIPVSERLPPRG